jgi:hypothetical protein
MPRVVFEVIDYSVSRSGTWGGTLSYLFICPYSTRIIRDHIPSYIRLSKIL